MNEFLGVSNIFKIELDKCTVIEELSMIDRQTDK